MLFDCIDIGYKSKMQNSQEHNIVKYFQHK